MKPLFLLLAICLVLSACDKPTQTSSEDHSVAATTEKPDSIDADSETTDKPDSADDDFEWSPERFADVQIIRYQIPGFDELKPRQKALVYYLVQAGLAGRDILWDQNYRHNLSIRRALEAIMSGEPGSGGEWDALSTYARRVFFSNGIHHPAHLCALSCSVRPTIEYCDLTVSIGPVVNLG